MIRISPHFEVALENELKSEYLRGYADGMRKAQQIAEEVHEKMMCDGYCHKAKPGEVFSCGCVHCHGGV
jgi:hypothetical protein